MANKIKLFEISVYDDGDGYRKDEIYNRYSTIYCAATNLETAIDIAKSKVTGKKKVVGGSEKVDAEFYLEG